MKRKWNIERKLKIVLDDRPDDNGDLWFTLIKDYYKSNDRTDRFTFRLTLSEFKEMQLHADNLIHLHSKKRIKGVI